MWNEVLAIAEGGIDESMAQLNQYAESTNSLDLWMTAAVSNGWDKSGDVYSIQNRPLGDGSYDVSCKVTGPTVEITSTGTLTRGSDTLTRTVIVSVQKTFDEYYTNGVFTLTKWSEQ